MPSEDKANWWLPGAQRRGNREQLLNGCGFLFGVMTMFDFEGHWGLFWESQRVHEEKAMAPHSSTLAWKIPWMEEPGRLQSMGSLGVGHD